MPSFVTENTFRVLARRPISTSMGRHTEHTGNGDVGERLGELRRTLGEVAGGAWRVRRV